MEMPEGLVSHMLISMVMGRAFTISPDDCDDDYMSMCASGGLFRLEEKMGSKHGLIRLSSPLLSYSHPAIMMRYALFATQGYTYPHITKARDRSILKDGSGRESIKIIKLCQF